MNDPFIIMNWCSLSLVILFTQKYTFTDISMATLVFVRLLLAWSLFSSFIFHWFVSIIFQVYSYRQHFLSLDFLFNLTVSAIWLRYLNHLHLMWLSIWFGFNLPSCNLFSLCFFSSLFYFSSLPPYLLLAY